ncbi:hypothetical protein BDW74DRAFT_155141 [Aspergillus multicolor]|uniref:uncharacterized protein n=1 Tax=Aspergillus multicolor TaxID=41759 RepID=UPI003CCD816C
MLSDAGRMARFMSDSEQNSPIDPDTLDQEGKVISFIGCGTIGRAVLTGLLRVVRSAPDDSFESYLHFYAVTRTKESADRL